MKDGLLSLIGMITAVTVILVLAYYCTRFIAVRGGMGLGQMTTGKHLRVLDQLALGRDIKLLVTQAGERYFLLAVSPSGVELLAEFTEEQAAEWRSAPDQAQDTPSFREAFLRQLKQRNKK